MNISGQMFKGEHPQPDSSPPGGGLKRRIAESYSIVLTAVCLFILIFGIAIFLGYRQFVTARHNALANDKTAANLLADLILEHNRATIGILQSYAQRPRFIDAVKSRDLAEVHRHLSDLNHNAEIDLTFVTDTRGVLWVNFPVFPEAIGKDLSSRDWYKGTSAHWNPYISTVFQLIVGDKPLAAAFCVPILDEKERVIGILGTSQRLGFLVDAIQRVPLIPYTTVTVIDRAGQMLYSNQFPYQASITAHRFFPVISSALMGKKQQLEMNDPQKGQGKSYLTVVPVGESGWSVIIERSLNDIYRSEFRRFIEIGAVSFLLFLLLLFFMVYLRKVSLLKKTEQLLKAEEEIRKHELHYRSTLDQMLEGGQILGFDWHYLYINATAEKHNRRPNEELLGKKYMDMWPGIEATEMFDVMRRCMEERSVYRGENRFIFPDGTTGWFMLSIQPVQEGIFILSIDITDRKRAEEALQRLHDELEQRVVDRTEELRKKQEQLRDAYRLAHIGVWNWIADTDTVTWTEELYRIAGLDPMIPAPTYADHSNIYAPESWDRLKVAVGKAMETGAPYLVELELIRPDGATRWVNAFGGATYDDHGLLTGLQGTVQDITERKRMEEALLESENQYHMLFEAIADTVFLIDQESGRILDVNPAATLMYGFNREEFLQMTTTDVSAEPEKTARATSEPVPFIPLRYHRHKDGSVFPVELTANIFELHGRKTIIATARDITERQRSEEEKKNFEERLQRAEKMESIGVLAGGVAHDLNNMLGALIGHAELLKGDLKKTDPLYDTAESIMTSGQQAATVVQDLLTMARRGVILKEPASLNKIVADQLKSSEIRNMLDSHPSAIIKTQYDRNLLDINASAIHIERTLTNLVSNALRAIRGGDGKITIKTENRYLESPLMGYEAVPKGEYAVLSVSDTGIGIFPEHMKNLFEPFFMRKTLKKGGSGLGLSVIWGAMKDHDGYVDVTSELAQGTTFSLYFPVTRDDTVRWVEHSVDEYRGYGETVLVVDDEDVQCRVAEKMLTRLNYVVKTVESGEEALDYLADHDVDLIVLDMIMEPGMDGYDTYRRIVEMKKEQKAIIFSGFTKTQRVKMAQELGAGEFIMKPYLMERLGIAVRKELDSNR